MHFQVLGNRAGGFAGTSQPLIPGRSGILRPETKMASGNQTLTVLWGSTGETPRKRPSVCTDTLPAQDTTKPTGPVCLWDTGHDSAATAPERGLA